MKQPPPKTRRSRFDDDLANVPTIDDAIDSDEDMMAELELDIPILTDLANQEGGETLPEADAFGDSSAGEPAKADRTTHPDSGGKPPTEQPSRFSGIPAADSVDTENIDRIVEDLVFENLPRLEHQLRIRLYDYLTSLKKPDAGRD